MGSKSLIALLLVLISIGLFFYYVQPTYNTIQTLVDREQQLEDALTKARELQAERDSLLARFNTFDKEELARLRKMIPDNVDNVRLILDMDSIAKQYSVALRDFEIENSAAAAGAQGQAAVGQANNPAAEAGNMLHNSLVLKFQAEASYESLLAFISNLERSLRLVDVELIEFESQGFGVEDSPYTFNISIRTYWLQ